MSIRVGILTVSDRAASGHYEDQSGPVLAEFVKEQPDWEITNRIILPDDRFKIAGLLKTWSGSGLVDLILTTGGTGFSPRDLTPEATRDVIDREAPGMAEAMRAASLLVTPYAMLSRGVCGIRGRTLIINLPGNPKAIRENLDVISSVLPHALDLLREDSNTESDHRALDRTL
jgi:molybdenum cofactor synthesis domain-containing protein